MYMMESTRNVRTLIVSFVIAIMVLVPLRFVEVGETMETMSQDQVLGVETQRVMPETYQPAPVSAQVRAVPTSGLEAPYDKIDGATLGAKPAVLGAQTVKATTGCITSNDGTVLVKSLQNRLANDTLTPDQVQNINEQISQIRTAVCK